MIFVTVGAQMPFDRLIGWVDEWAVARERRDFSAQTGPSDLVPRALEPVPFLDPRAFRQHMESADAVVAHAGMGTILTALELGKPILVVPRLGARNETRNDHQVATAEHFAKEGLVLAAYDEAGFALQMTRLDAEIESRLEGGSYEPRIGARGSDSLLARLREFAVGESWPPPGEAEGAES